MFPREGCIRKAFVHLSANMVEASHNLEQAAFVEVIGRLIKEDDVQSTLAHKAQVPSSRTTRKLATDHHFFVSRPSTDIVHQLTTAGQIKGEGFHLQVSHWDQFRGGLPHKLKLKVSASLFNLPLVC